MCHLSLCLRVSELFFQVEFMVHIFVCVFLLVQKVPVDVNEGVSPQVCVPVFFFFVPLTVIHRCVPCQPGQRVCGAGVCAVSNCFNSTWSLILGN